MLARENITLANGAPKRVTGMICYPCARNGPFENGAPGGITRRCAPRPSGRPKGRSPPLRGVVEPLILCRGFDRLANPCRETIDNFFENGAPGGIRTHDPRLRRPILYPAELRAQRRGGDTTRRRQAPSSGSALSSRRPGCLCRFLRCRLQLEYGGPVAGCDGGASVSTKRLN
jgi:hypothetical protein